LFIILSLRRQSPSGFNLQANMRRSLRVINGTGGEQ